MICLQTASPTRNAKRRSPDLSRQSSVAGHRYQNLNQIKQTMKTTRPILPLLATSLFVAWAAQPVWAEQAPAFELTKIAEADNTTVYLWPAAALNNRGQVGYSLVRLDDFSTTIAVADRRASATVLTLPQGQPAGVSALNDSGRLGLLIEEYDMNTLEIVRYRFAVGERGWLNTVADVPAPPQGFAPYIAEASINNGGVTAFTVIDVVEDIRSTLYAGRVTPLAVIAQGTSEGDGNPIRLALNNSNAVAYWKWEGSGVSDPAVFVWQSGATTRRIDSSVFLPEETSGFGIREFRGLAMNDHGAIAVGTGRRIVRWDQGTLTTIAQAKEGFLVGYAGKMNNGGQVTFSGAEDPDGDGTAPGALYVGGDSKIQRILGAQDTLWGKTVDFVLTDGEINERGQVVFPVQFTDGSSAIVLATPAK